MAHSAEMAGLSIQSEFELPGVCGSTSSSQHQHSGAPIKPLIKPNSSSSVGADVVVIRGSVPEQLPQAIAVGPTMQLADRQLLLSIPKVARFLLQDGNSITVDLAEGVPETEVGVFLIGTVFGMLLHQRGCLVLHASAVEVDGGAVLFCGVSGAGKSTLAAALNEKGYGFISDDVCAIGQDDEGRSVVQSDCRRLKLWEDAITRLALGERKQQSVRNAIEKYYVPPRRQMPPPHSIPVLAIYLLRKSIADEGTVIEPLNKLDALTQIRLNAYRPRLQSALVRDQRYLNQCSALIQQAGVFLIKRSWGLSRLDKVVAELETHWRQGLSRHG